MWAAFSACGATTALGARGLSVPRQRGRSFVRGPSRPVAQPGGFVLVGSTRSAASPTDGGCVASIEALVCGFRHEAAWLERNVLEGAALSPWNRAPGGQETPGHCPGSAATQAQARCRAPSHEPIAAGSIFGAILGGLQVRRAVAGPHRLYPLAYTGTISAPNERWSFSAALPSVTKTPSPTR